MRSSASGTATANRDEAAAPSAEPNTKPGTSRSCRAGVHAVGRSHGWCGQQRRGWGDCWGGAGGIVGVVLSTTSRLPSCQCVNAAVACGSACRGLPELGGGRDPENLQIRIRPRNQDASSRPRADLRSKCGAQHCLVPHVRRSARRQAYHHHGPGADAEHSAAQPHPRAERQQIGCLPCRRQVSQPGTGGGCGRVRGSAVPLLQRFLEPRLGSDCGAQKQHSCAEETLLCALAQPVRRLCAQTCG